MNLIKNFSNFLDNLEFQKLGYFQNHKCNPIQILKYAAFTYSDNNLYNEVSKKVTQGNDAGSNNGHRHSSKILEEFHLLQTGKNGSADTSRIECMASSRL